MSTMGVIGQGVGTGVNLVGEYQAKKANEAITDYNAKVLDLQAVDAIKRGEETVGNVLTDARRLRGSQRAALAAQGIDLSSEVATNLANDTQDQAARDVRTARTNANREAWGLKTQRTALRMAGDAASRASNYRMVGSALTGGAQTAAMYRDYKTKA